MASAINEKGLDNFPEAPMGEGEENGFILHHDWHVWYNSVVDSVPKFQPFAVAINPASIAANSTSEETVTVTGLTTQDVVVLNKPTHTADIVLNCRVTADDTLSVTFANLSGGAIDLGEETYRGYAIRL